MRAGREMVSPAKSTANLDDVARNDMASPRTDVRGLRHVEGWVLTHPVVWHGTLCDREASCETVSTTVPNARIKKGSRCSALEVRPGDAGKQAEQGLGLDGYGD